jgi:hypothetical protein
VTKPREKWLSEIVAEHDVEGMRAWLASRIAEGPNGCHLWQRRIHNGYAMKTGQLMHRIVFSVLVGPIPDGDHVHHVCGRRSCVNPDHLTLSTHRENIGEMLARRAYEARLSNLESLLERFMNAARVHDFESLSELVGQADEALTHEVTFTDDGLHGLGHD